MQDTRTPLAASGNLLYNYTELGLPTTGNYKLRVEVVIKHVEDGRWRVW